MFSRSTPGVGWMLGGSGLYIVVILARFCLLIYWLLLRSECHFWLMSIIYICQIFTSIMTWWSFADGWPYVICQISNLIHTAITCSPAQLWCIGCEHQSWWCPSCCSAAAWSPSSPPPPTALFGDPAIYVKIFENKWYFGSECLDLITWMPSAAKEVGRPRSCASWAQPSARAQEEEEGREGNMIGDSSLGISFIHCFSVQVYCITNELSTIYTHVGFLPI